MPQQKRTKTKPQETVDSRLKKHWKILLVLGVSAIVTFVQLTISKPIEQQPQTQEHTTTNRLSEFSDEDLNRGWYWGTQEQRKPGTPNDWTYQEGGRNSKWIKPETTTNTYKCPANGWVDCMPGPGAIKYECTAEAMSWFKANCPNFQGGAY